MAKKKEEDITVDWREIFNNYVAPKIYKIGLEDYIIKNGYDKKIKSQKDFDKIVSNFNQITMG